jgi:hypothetical protein
VPPSSVFLAYFNNIKLFSIYFLFSRHKSSSDECIIPFILFRLQTFHDIFSQSLSLSLYPFIHEDFIPILFSFLHFCLYIHNPSASFLFFQVRINLVYQCKSILHVLTFVRAQLVLSLISPSGCPSKLLPQFK